ncbi:MAG: RluA family pseudouridine synthase [Deltaproteobacteria bacterium]|nr:RluA family pseudouridine synthase [Deltaproteobacteria bacterium]
MPSIQRFIVAHDLAGQRLDRALAHLTVATRSHIKMLIEHACVRVVGEERKAGYVLRSGDEIEVRPLSDPPAQALPQDLPLEVLYEDEFLAAINKPPGMVVHPAPGQWQGTVVNALLARWGWQEGASDNLRPGIIHRLDKDTSGVLLVAKDPTTQERVSLQFKERRVQKMYVAVAVGRLAQSHGEIRLPIGRHPSERKKMSVHAHRSRPAVSRYQVVGEALGISLVRLFPETGRTHQIRVHLAALGHPIVGDLVYGSVGRFGDLPAALRDFPRQALHARAIRFCHPATQRLLTLWAPYPEDLRRIFATLPFVVEEQSPEEILNRDGKSFAAS